MTALTQYARLESVGRWRQPAGSAGREVGVSFGTATLVLTDEGGDPLAHWSLPALRRLNPGALPALYAPDPEASETLEVEDDLLVSAIDRVSETVARARRAPRRAGRALLAGVAAFLVGTALLWAPGALRRQALAVVPDSKRAEIGATLLGYLAADYGEACRDPLGTTALEALRQRLLGSDARGQAVVLPGGPPAPVALPGGLVVLPEATVEAAGEPLDLAAAILAARAAAPDPLEPLLDRMGLIGTLRLLATGEPPAAAVAAHAAALAASPPEADPATLDRARAAAGLAASPPPVLLTDGEWVSLQGICRAEG